MATQTPMATEPTRDAVVEQKLQKLRELYADAPEVGKVALQNGMADIAREFAALTGATGVQSAGRVGARQGKVSELTAILQIAKGGAKRLRGLLELVEGNFRGADVVGTLHDMRFVFLENDTKLLFATAYDGEWDAYIDDFVTKIPTSMDIFFCNLEGWPGIRQSEGEGLARQAPDHGRRLVCRQSESDGRGDATARAGRQGGRRIPRQDFLAAA